MTNTKTVDFDSMEREAFSRSPAALDLWNRSSYARSVSAMFTVLRTEAQLTQKDIAERTGWNKAFVSRLESARGGSPDAETVRRYAEACGVSVGFVFASKASETVGHIHGAVAIEKRQPPIVKVEAVLEKGMKPKDLDVPFFEQVFENIFPQDVSIGASATTGVAKKPAAIKIGAHIGKAHT